MATFSNLKDRYFCLAKINLGLEVLRKRDDGYHELNTLFVRVQKPHDVIQVAPSNRFRLTGSNEDLALDDSNLIVKAIRAFCKETGEDVPLLHLHLDKNIPMGAGLGGGSSDAATALVICNDYFGQGLPQERLMELGAKVGADVPFFLSGAEAAIGSGIGEVLTEVTMPLRVSLLIIKPASISISTKDAYNRIKLTNAPATDLLNVIGSRNWRAIRNDFESAIFPLAPELQTIKNALTESGAIYASMSGSGSSIYGLFDSEQAIAKAMDWAKTAGYPHWRTEIGQNR